MTLEQFTTEVKSSDIWMNMIHSAARGKDLQAAITKVYGQVVSDETILSKPITEHRKHIFNTLVNQPFNKSTGVSLQQEPVKKEEVKILESVSSEVQQDRLSRWLKSISQVPDQKRVPKLSAKEIAEEGGWVPKKKQVAYDTGYAPEHFTKLHQSRIKIVRDRHPEMNDEEIEEYIYKNYPNKI